MKRAVIANGLSEKATECLKQFGIDVVETKANIAVNENISFHGDISFLYDGYDTLFIASEMAEYKDIFSSFVSEIIVIPERLGCDYPSDVLLNCVTVGRKLVCNVDTVSPTVLKYFTEMGYDVINVNQGYTKCSVLPVSDNAIITDDPSIAKACVLHCVDVLTVSKGAVKLAGYSYGFIGGASGKIFPDTVAFCGDIDTHPDSASIRAFLSKYGINALSLDNNRLYDIGSIIPLYGG